MISEDITTKDEQKEKKPSLAQRLERSAVEIALIDIVLTKDENKSAAVAETERSPVRIWGEGLFLNRPNSKNLYTLISRISIMGFINIVKNKPKSPSKPNAGPKKSSMPKLPKINTKQLMAIGLIILGLIFIGIAIMTW